jgi:inhibitor of KinA
LPKYKLSYKPYGDAAILIEWPSIIDQMVLDDIVGFKAKIIQNINLQEVIVGYNSLLLVSSYKIEDVDDKIYALNQLYKQSINVKTTKSKHWEIPVCYDAKFGIDLEVISKTNNLSIQEIIKRHTESIYTVYFIGFLPGFLYLGGLDESLAIPRKSVPRFQVPKGAVAIGGSQTGIYPIESSGGWNIIGNSPISFFDINNDTPCFAKTGDTVSFKSISMNTYEELDKLNMS